MGVIPHCSLYGQSEYPRPVFALHAAFSRIAIPSHFFSEQVIILSNRLHCSLSGSGVGLARLAQAGKLHFPELLPLHCYLLILAVGDVLNDTWHIGVKPPCLDI